MAVKKRIRTVEYDPRWYGWIARDPDTGKEIMEEGFRWNSRSVARAVVLEARAMAEVKRRKSRTVIARTHRA